MNTNHSIVDLLTLLSTINGRFPSTFVHLFFVSDMLRLLPFFVLKPLILLHITFDKLRYFSNTCVEFIMLTKVALCDAVTGLFIFWVHMTDLLIRDSPVHPPPQGYPPRCGAQTKTILTTMRDLASPVFVSKSLR